MKEFMKALKNLALAIAGLAISIAGSIMLMVYGWGLTPKNWWIIVPGYLGMSTLAQIFIILAKDNKEDK